MATAIQPGRAENGGAAAGNTTVGLYDPLRQVVRMRTDPTTPEAAVDSAIIERYQGERQAQTQMLLVRDRQIEYNVRMLLGQQWNQWHPVTGRFYDTSEWLTDADKAWRKLPVINKLLRYFMVTHSRLTEGTPILTMLPGPDRVDAELASVLDTLFKKDWRDANMEDVHDLAMMWLIVAGRAHLISRIDLTGGEWHPWIADTHVPIHTPDGLPMPGPDGQPLRTPAPMPDIPLDSEGNPNAYVTTDGRLVHTAPPHMERMGAIAVDVYSPLQVRGQWGPQPWHRKQWHEVTRFLTPEEVYQAWGVEVEPDLTNADASNIATLERVLFGSGFFTGQLGRLSGGWSDQRVKGGLCTVHERWQAPLPFDERLIDTWVEPMIETPDNPGGRHTVWTPKRVIRDGPREEAWRYTSPVRTFDFVRLAGRPSGVSPLEMMLAPQRAYNRSRGQLEEQSALLGNPQVVVDSGFGLLASQLTNRPGEIYVGNKRPGVKAVEYLEAPPVSPDVLKSIQFAASEIEELGGMRGLEGAAPTGNASGDLVEELRYNADRILGSTARRMPSEYARMADDWRLLYRRIYTVQTIVAINGDEQVAETLTVLPEVFKDGHVNVMPDAESMLPEGRGERQARAERLFEMGAFGDINSIEARETFLTLARFPNYGKMARPGGPDRATAEQENGAMLMGQFEQPVLEWYDHMVHLTVHERYMKSRAFLKQPEQVRMAFAIHRILHLRELQKMFAASGGMPGAPMGGGGAPALNAGEAPENGGPPQLTPGAPTAPRSVRENGGRSPTALTAPEG